MILFDAIDKQEVYDEGEIVEKFAGQLVLHRFSIAKGRLYNQIIDSLDAYHSKSSIDAELKKPTHAAEVLYTTGKKWSLGH